MLIRPQAENTKPPRALWVPFELGRPFGPPNDPAFQRRVVLAALGMLVEDGGPVRIIDFPDDDPRARPDPAWQQPFIPATVANGSGESLASRMEAEIVLLQGANRLLRPIHTSGGCRHQERTDPAADRVTRIFSAMVMRRFRIC